MYHTALVAITASTRSGMMILMRFAATTSSKRAAAPEIEQRVDVGIDRVHRPNVEHLMDEHVGVQRADEQQRARAGIVYTQDAGSGGAAEVVGEDPQAP